MAVSDAVPTAVYDISTTLGITPYGSDEGVGYNYTIYGIDEDFIPTNGMTLVAGRNFEKGSSNKGKVIVNETAVRLMGFKSPEDAIGKRLNFWLDPNTVIVGVMSDFHQLSLKEAVQPMLHWYSTRSDFFTVKLQTEHLAQTLQAIEKNWKAFYPEYPFNYHFMNELLDQQYQADRRFGQVVGVFSILVLLITCLGVLGLTAYTIHKRTKEIGIRKVLGASVQSILTLLSLDFIKLVLMALLLATPISWYAMNSWLESYAVRIEIQWWLFAVVGIFAVLMTLLALGYQSLKAAWTNPVESLRAE